MDLLSADKLASIITSATEDVFSTMLGLPVKKETHHIESSGGQPFDGVIALIGLTGQWIGAARVSCSATLACRMSGALLASEYKAVDEDVLDAMGELANMIIGNVKSTLEDELGPMGLSIPTVIFGRNYQARSAGVKEWMVARYACESEHFDIRFALMPNGAAEVPRSAAVLEAA